MILIIIRINYKEVYIMCIFSSNRRVLKSVTCVLSDLYIHLYLYLYLYFYLYNGSCSCTVRNTSYIVSRPVLPTVCDTLFSKCLGKTEDRIG